MSPERRVPPEITGDEARYLRRLAEAKTSVIVHLTTGETCRGWIEYFDVRFIRLTSDQGPNRFIFKEQIKYIAEAKRS